MSSRASWWSPQLSRTERNSSYDYLSALYLSYRMVFWYYGVRFAKGCHPSDLWVKYFTSSRHVKMFIKSNGNPDIIQIRKTFDSAAEARKYEEKVLKRMKVRHRKDFLNITDTNQICSKAMGDGLYNFWNNMTEEERKERTSRMRSYIMNPAGPKNISHEERKRRSSFMKEMATKRQASLSKDKKSNYGKAAGLASVKKRKTVKCPHCDKEGPKPSMVRWHFDNCRQ